MGRKTKKYYSATRAQKQADTNKFKNRKQHKLLLHPKLCKAVLGLLKDKKTTYSPDVIAALSKKKMIEGVSETIGANTIYNAAKTRKFGFKIVDLPHGRLYYKKDAKNVHTLTKEIDEKKKDISIEKMPQEIKDKKVDTHFEGDTIVGQAKGTHNTLITLVNTMSQFTFIKRSQNKTAQATVDVINELNAEVPELDKIMKSLLLDNGVEFSKWEDIMSSNKGEDEKRMQVYFAHPYASYERGCNENKNRMVRRTFKKGTLVETLTDEDILDIARRINNMPRKALGYQTPLEVFEKNLNAKNVNTKFLDAYRIKKSKYLSA